MGAVTTPDPAGAPAVSPVLYEDGVAVPMPDGTVLRADVARPADGRPAPVLLSRTPYAAMARSYAAGTPMASAPALLTHLQLAGTGLSVPQVVEAGFAVVAQACRGTERSDGVFRCNDDEASDGRATAAWLRAQPWCDGTVHGFGGSYVSQTQMRTCLGETPSLDTLSPWVAPSTFYDDLAGRGGVPTSGLTASWALNRVNDARARDGLEPLPPASDAAALVEVLALYPGGRHVLDWQQHPLWDEYWDAFAYPAEALASLDRPAFHLAGWYDVFLGGTLRNFEQMRRGPASDRQVLIAGPWTHIDQVGRVPLAHDFGPASTLAGGGIDALQLAFWRWHSGFGADQDLPVVRLFVMGADEWRDYPDWPVPGAVDRPAYLRPDGVLGWDRPAAAACATGWVHDPGDPVPTCGGQILVDGMPVDADGTCFSGPLDQRPVEARADVVSFTTAPLAEPVEVIGPVRLRAWVAVDAAEADLHATLTDVAPDGTSRILTDGVRRLSLRESFRERTPVVPGEPVEVEVDLWATANRFEVGHRIRLNLAASNAPRYDVSDPDGGRPVRLSVLHEAAHPSHVVLPVVG